MQRYYRYPLLALLTLLLTLPYPIFGQNSFDKWFHSKALRIDYILGGDSKSQHLYLSELIEEPYWSGSPHNTIDDQALGDYRVEVTDKESGELIFSQGFCTLFQEWQTTPEAAYSKRAFEQVTRIPFPKNDVTATFFFRNRQNGALIQLAELNINPDSKDIRRKPVNEYPVRAIVNSGDPQESLDLVLIAEGFIQPQMDDFIETASKFTEHLLGTAPFDTYKDRINVWAVEVPSEESGVTHPPSDQWINTAMGASFHTFGIERYLTTPNLHRTMDIAANAPGDAIAILVNTDEYGGGGIYNHYAITSTNNEESYRVLVHELGHSLAGLADEYYTSDVAYQDYYPKHVEPWEQNITTLVDFGKKWHTMIPPNTPIPTPNEPPYIDNVGVFEGAGYSPKGIYRPYNECIMKSSGAKEFCPVCRKAISRVIEGYLINTE